MEDTKKSSFERKFIQILVEKFKKCKDMETAKEKQREIFYNKFQSKEEFE